MPDVATEALQTSDMHLSEGKCALSTLIFQKFSGGYAPDPHTGEGLRRPSPDPTPSALRRFAPPRLARDLRSLHLHVPPYRNPGYAPAPSPFKNPLSYGLIFSRG